MTRLLASIVLVVVTTVVTTRAEEVEYDMNNETVTYQSIMSLNPPSLRESFRGETYVGSGSTLIITCQKSAPMLPGEYVQFTRRGSPASGATPDEEKEEHTVYDGNDLNEHLKESKSASHRYKVEGITDDDGKLVGKRLVIDYIRSQDSGTFKCMIRYGPKEPQYTSHDHYISIAERIRTDVVTMGIHLPENRTLETLMEGDRMAVVCKMDSNNVEPLMKLTLGRRNLTQYLPLEVENQKLSSDEVTGMMMKRVTYRYEQTSRPFLVKCEDNMQPLACVGYTPIRQRVGRTVEVKVLGCAEAGAATQTGMLLLLMGSMMAALFM